jgi:ankyrin repeat protein
MKTKSGLITLSLLTALFCFSLLAGRVSAETVQLLSGRSFEGELIEETEEYLRIQTEKDIVKIPLRQIQSRTEGESVGKEQSVSPDTPSSQELLLGALEEDKFKAKVKELFLNKKFAELEEMAKDFRENRTRTGIGNWKLDLFYRGIAEVYEKKSVVRIEDDIKIIQEWGGIIPGSVTQKIALAEAYKNLAWEYRGGGFGNTVSEEQGEAFKKYLTKSNLILAESETLSPNDPYLYSLWIWTGLGLSYRKDNLYSMLEKGMEIEPGFLPSYYAMAVATLPRWGGQPGETEAFVDWVANKIKETYGEQLYALIAMKIRKYVGDTDFVAFRFSWPRIKKGLDEFLKIYPSNLFVLNAYAWFACNANDQGTAQEQFNRIGSAWDKESEKFWYKKEKFDYWKKWAFQNAPVYNPKALNLAIRKADYTAVKEMLGSVKDINQLDENGEALLHYAISKSSEDIVDLLMDSGADIRLKTSAGWEPIHYAAWGNHLNIMKNLVTRGVPINPPSSKDSLTPLHLAADGGFLDIVEYILSSGTVDINVGDKENLTPLYYASIKGRKNIIEFLISQPGIKIDPVTEEQRFTPLLKASYEGFYDIVKLLVDHGADIKYINSFGLNALDQAKRQGHKDIYDFLKSKGAEEAGITCWPDDIKKANEIHYTGNEYMKQKQYEKAKELFSQALEICPDMPGTYFNLYLIYFNNDRDFPKALSSINKAIELDPKVAQYHFEAAQTLMTLRREEEAKEHMREFIRLDPENYRVQLLLERFPDLADEVRKE